MPPLIYGTAWKKERTADLVIQAIKAGFCGIDTACQPKHYNESLVGEALVKLGKHNISRDSLFLQTKFTPLSGQDPNQGSALRQRCFINRSGCTILWGLPK